MLAILATSCLYDTGESHLVGPQGPPSAQVDPLPLSTGIPVNPRLALRFDRHLDPFEVDPPAAVRLTTGSRQVELEVWWDPLDRALYAEPTAALKSGVRYVFEVVSAAVMPDLAGRTLGEEAVMALRSPFTVDSEGAVRDLPAPLTDESDPAGEFERWVVQGPGQCGGCHASGALYPGTDLALDDLPALINRPARTSPARILVIPGHPERSYLMHKMLQDYPDIGGVRMPILPGGFDFADADRRRMLRATQIWIRALPAL